VRAREVIHAFGHENVRATHRTTLEITKESHLTTEGDCIVAVSADKALSDLDEEFKKCLLQNNSRITILIEADGVKERIVAQGNPLLHLTHPSDIVVRKSSHTCSRTLAIDADKAACDLSRTLVARLKNPKQEVKITLVASV
jgi:hypothetical protein